MRRRPGWNGAVLAALAASATLAAFLVPAGSAAADVTTHQTLTVPTTGKDKGAFAFSGHGWGHGHGLSQYGARGAARKGLSAHQILSFYYPGTTIARTTGTIRVLITADTTRDVQVAVQKGLSVTDLGTGKSYPLPTKKGVVAWRLNVDHGKAVVAYRIHAWHRYVLAKGLATLKGDGEFQATSRKLTLITPSGREAVRGALRAASPTKGSSDRDTVDVLSIDSYVRGVVPSEMPTSWETAAVRAQAVAARTYALFERAENASRYYEICDTSACQVYGGLRAETAAGDAAVDATAGEYLSYQGAPAFTQFSSSDGGWTAAGTVAGAAVRYLPAKKDPYDAVSGNPNHSWTTQVKASVLQKKYPKLGTLTSLTITSRTGGGQWKGRVVTARLTGTKGTVSVTGADLQAAYGLRSTWFLPVKAS
jgi:stage II sporulation protein D